MNKINLFSLFHCEAKELQGNHSIPIKIANASTTIYLFYKMCLNKHVFFCNTNYKYTVLK